MPSELEISTLAWSVHEAVTVNDRPMSAGEIADFLRRVYEDTIENAEVEAALMACIGRMRMRQIGTPEKPLFDTLYRKRDGGRASPPGRNRDHTSLDFGWF